MKKFLYTLIAVFAIINFVSCQDMLDTDSSRQSFDPNLNNKTDSVSYAYGVLRTVQQVADQYFFQNELRGELVSCTSYTKVDLRNLYNLTADQTNKYDSVYLYYNVINNCNYYLANRDTALYTGNINVSINEYIAIASLRAWTYLQLARMCGDGIIYVTKPLTSISQINNNAYPKYDLKTICLKELENLEFLRNRYPGATVPNYGIGEDGKLIGSTNWGAEKKFMPSRCFVPIDIMMGELYLEYGDYKKAAYSYFNYLKTEGKVTSNFCNRYSPRGLYSYQFEWPSDYETSENSRVLNTSDWNDIYLMSPSPNDVITYIPMAVNYMTGQVTEIPAVFGYDYYANSVTTYARQHYFSPVCPELREIQLIPSQEYNTLADTATYYYYQKKLKNTQTKYTVGSSNLGDGRANFLSSGKDEDSLYTWVNKHHTGNIILFRTSTVYLHLAEALNRMGYPDAAFAILKDGMQYGLRTFVNNYESTDRDSIFFYKQYMGQDENEQDIISRDSTYYLRPSTFNMLQTEIPFFAESNVEKFTNSSESNLASQISCPIVGIHRHGAGVVNGFDSPYQFQPVLTAKLQYLNSKFSLGIGEKPTLEDYINAMEDILCDEYALEFAFEGTRFADLQRLARHKNEEYKSGFGDIWLADKLKDKSKQINTLNDCYLPFK